MAVGAAKSAGRFEIVRKRTYATHAEVHRKKLKADQRAAAANAANVMFGTIATHSAGLSEIAVRQATERTTTQTVASILDTLS